MNRAEALGMAKDKASKQEAELAATRKPENVLNLLQVDPVELEIGYGLIPPWLTRNRGRSPGSDHPLAQAVRHRARSCDSCHQDQGQHAACAKQLPGEDQRRKSEGKGSWSRTGISPWMPEASQRKCLGKKPENLPLACRPCGWTKSSGSRLSLQATQWWIRFVGGGHASH